MSANPIDLIRKKRDGKKLDAAEIRGLVAAYTRGEIPDYQMSAFLMAVYFKGLDPAETTSLMDAMMGSGEVLDLSSIRRAKVDKHSTGGVGDKVSLVLAPLVASCGVCVPMISGRGLGHTGGTLDKLASIPGFRTDLKIDEFKSQLAKIGVAMIGQTAEIAPADRKIYALRDVTATVDSIPLIAASIMSKKLSEDLDGLVLDVKCGSGAFMSDYDNAKRLARTMVRIGSSRGVKTIAVLTDMDNPLGKCVGNSLEVIEAIEALKGNGPDDLMEVTYTLAAVMLDIAKKKGGRVLLEKKIANGEALAKFRDMVTSQGADARVIDDHSLLPLAKTFLPVVSPVAGYVHRVDGHLIGMLLIDLGGGRLKKEDTIDPSCGFRIHKKIGDRVEKGELLCEVLSDRADVAEVAAREMKRAFQIRRGSRKRKRLIRETIR